MTDYDAALAGQNRIFNVPVVVLISLAVLTLIHLIRVLAGDEIYVWTESVFAFIPQQYNGTWLQSLPGAQAWSFFSYSLLHGGWMHLATNGLWLVVFGSVVARRLGAWRYLIHAAIASAAGAGTTLMFHWGDTMYVVGASAIVSGQMAAAVPLMYASPGGLRQSLQSDLTDVRALKPLELLQRRDALVFLAIWLVVTLLSGATGVIEGGETVNIAWDAHLGGFIGGLIAFYLLDPGPVRR